MTQVTENNSGGAAAMSFPQILAFPVRTLWAGNFLVLLYALLCVGGSIKAATFIQQTLEEFLHGSATDSSFMPYLTASTYFMYFFCLPFIAVGAGLPIRIMWLYDDVFIGPLLSGTRKSAHKFVNILRFSYMQPVYGVIPLVGVLVIRHLALKENSSANLELILKVFAGATALLALYKLLEWVFLILLATFVDLNETFAIQNQRFILRQKLLYVLIVGASGFGGAAALYFSKIMHQPHYLSISLGVLLWYTFAVLIVVALEASEAAARINGATLRIVPQLADSNDA